MRPQKKGRRQRQRPVPCMVFFLLLGFSWRLTTTIQYLVDYYDKEMQESTEYLELNLFSSSKTVSIASSISSSKSSTQVELAAKNHIIKPSQQFTLSDGTVVSVGQIGPNVTYAKQCGFVQRNKGLPLDQWDIVESTNCDNYHSNNNTKGSSSFSSFATLSKHTPTNIIRKHWLPEAILIGVQKGGTTALYEYIDRHPEVAKSRKELYFLDELVDRLMLQHSQRNITTTTPTLTRYNHSYTIPHVTIRQEYSHRMKLAIKNNQRDAGKMILDLTPNYMYQSDRLPARIACVLPWAKIMALLRNPIHRARSQYDMKLKIQNEKNNRSKRRPSQKQQQQRRRPPPPPAGGMTVRKAKTSRRRNKRVLSFHQYVLNDLAALQETGVIQNWDIVDFDTFFNSPAMDEAWRTYLNNGLNAPIGMGLYAIQVKPFLQLVDHDFLAIQSEKLMLETDTTYGQVLDFLGLPRISLDWYHPVNHARKRDKTKVDQETEHLLYQVFAPFNRKLGELLGNEWVGVWEEE
jgi:hypothetical protein